MKKCFIIGNGPSQNNVDLTLLKDHTTFGVNGIWVKFDTFKPTYWVIADSVYWRAYEDEILADHGVHIITNCTRHLVTDNMTIIKVTGDVSKIRKNEIEFMGNKECYSIGNVAYIAFQLACAMGFDELNLIGIDAQEPRPSKGDHFSPLCNDRLPEDGERYANNSFPKDAWRKGYAWALWSIVSNGGAIYDVSNGRNGIFPSRRFEDSI